MILVLSDRLPNCIAGVDVKARAEKSVRDIGKPNGANFSTKYALKFLQNVNNLVVHRGSSSIKKKCSEGFF
jgi:hypothetical protein